MCDLFTLREGHELRVSDNNMLRKISGHKKVEVDR